MISRLYAYPTLTPKIYIYSEKTHKIHLGYVKLRNG